MAVAYDGHVTTSRSKAASEGDPNASTVDPLLRVAPADHVAFNPADADWADQPGAAARANGWPRA